MTALRAIFFDIGETLVFDDPPTLTRFETMARMRNLPIDASRLTPALRAVEAHALSVYDRFAADDPEVQRECASLLVTEVFGSTVSEEELTVLMLAFAEIPFRRYVLPGAIELLIELKERAFIVGAISDWDENLPALLDELGLMAHLDVLSVSQIVGANKPDPRLFHDALAKSGVAPDEALHVGDYFELDIAGARAAGMEAVLFDSKDRSPLADCPRFVTFAALRDHLLTLPPPRPS